MIFIGHFIEKLIITTLLTRINEILLSHGNNIRNVN